MTATATGEGQGDAGSDGRLGVLAAAVGATRTRGPAPVHAWHPPYCGEIDLRIAADGTWFYAGSPITRRPLVELFAGILRRDGTRYVLVTPAECVGIVVEDAPFVAVAMQRTVSRDESGNERQVLRFVTNVGDEVEAGAAHPLRFDVDGDGGIKPYVLVRDDLWARLTRSLAIDLLDLAALEFDADGRERPTIRSGGAPFPVGAGDPA